MSTGNGNVYSKGYVWLHPSVSRTNGFLMLPLDLLESSAFQSLNSSQQMLYITLAAHQGTSLHINTLKGVLTDYRDLGYISLSDYDIDQECMTPSKQKNTHGYFVFPAKHMKLYGYTSQSFYKLKPGLIKAGFIRVVCGQKGKHQGWSRNATLYQFDTRWKSFCSKPQDTIN